jgi:hypothetical protein
LDTLEFEICIKPDQQGTYFTHPFQVPDNVESLVIAYQYPRRPEKESTVEKGIFTSQIEENIIDLGVIDSSGSQIGASGSDKLEIKINEVESTPGYLTCRIQAGEWRLIIGAYKVSPEGVTALYQVHFAYKSRHLIKGDLHTHTLGSDGVHSIEELAVKASRNGLDFLAITDHNQMSRSNSFPCIPGVTLLPGVEWTHYQGHANFIGVDQPYDTPFFCNTPEEIRERFNSARERGALITVNHPFEEVAPFKLELSQVPFDCLEVWNGPMRESNLRAIGLWQHLLVSGKKIPISAGSDYHRDTPFIFLGGPTLCVYSMSDGPSDILTAVRLGHSYITFAPNGPNLQMSADSSIMGDTVKWPEVNEVEIKMDGLKAGDVLRFITQKDSQDVLEAKTEGKVTLHHLMGSPGFLRVELLRSFFPGLPMLPALISNPIYFDA